MTTIDHDMLSKITGGIMSRTRGNNREAASNICDKDAKWQYEVMKQRMTPNNSNKKGVRREVVEGMARLCHFPMPPK